MMQPRPMMVTDLHSRRGPRGGCYWCDDRRCRAVRFVNGHGWVALCETCTGIADG